LGSFLSEPMFEMLAIALHYLLHEINHPRVLEAKVDDFSKSVSAHNLDKSRRLDSPRHWSSLCRWILPKEETASQTRARDTELSVLAPVRPDLGNLALKSVDAKSVLDYV